jgi:OOP family OmpA-OmpF porin
LPPDLGHRSAARPRGDNSTEEGKRLNRRTNAVVACATDIEGLTVQPARVTMALRIEFERNMDAVNPRYHDNLQYVADVMKANPTVTAAVEGHTANVQATAQLALEISQRRAQNVVNYLVDDSGIDRSRSRAEGFGDGRRFAYNTSAEGQQENRRVNVIIDYPRK